MFFLPLYTVKFCCRLLLQAEKVGVEESTNSINSDSDLKSRQQSTPCHSDSAALLSTVALLGGGGAFQDPRFFVNNFGTHRDEATAISVVEFLTFLHIQGRVRF